MGLIAIKTNYGKKLDAVYAKLCEGKKRIANLKDNKGYCGVGIRGKNFFTGRQETYWVVAIGCNSFGIEVKYGGGGWCAIEELSPSQQDKIVKAIDWSTLK